MPENENWEFSILVPDNTLNEELLPAEEATLDSLTGAVRKVLGWRVQKIGTKSVEAQWDRTFETLMKLSNTVTERMGKWAVEQVEVGLTLSAKGELLFIAGAGAEANIKFLMKPKAPDERSEAD